MSDYLLQYPTCPRCNNSWEDVSHDNTMGYNQMCSQCKMRMCPATGLLRLVLADKWIVYWYQNNRCEINIAIPNSAHMSGFQPSPRDEVSISHWLKFDITAERLKLLLVFS